jgi:hypothetical protein
VIAWFCVECFSEVDPAARECPVCEADIPRGSSDYEAGLIRALRHPKLPDRQVFWRLPFLASDGRLAQFRT